ncbi:PIN domain-containing protein [Inhella gelatinilytica]|uniref:PIN domain-containing protein n=1 Tax=Inhella gelatinilytica TaxID=2795030 RepID=A0A931ISJ3_9BURK|nr:PIN domain-containing protein [Inhella gelatinilytica]MBH9551349.1 PIN domain-containing protein [Inhella gelatinilytica]
MNPLTFVDSGVLLAAFDVDAPRRERARQWLVHCWTQRTGRLSTQVLDAFYAQARARYPSALSAGDARAEVRRYQLWHPWSTDHATVESAWAVESRWGLPYADALLIASAQQQSCEWFLSETLPHGQVIDRVSILNPFQVDPVVAGSGRST